MRKPIALAAACAFLVGCEQARQTSADAAAKALIAECGFAIEVRRANRDAVTASVARQGHNYRAVAQDCEPPHDGEPDFR